MSKTEIEQLVEKAKSGNTVAMFALAQRYRDGNGVKQDFVQFLDWLNQLRKRLGFSAKIKSLLSFEGRPANALKKFVAWLKASAAAGQATHMNFLAFLYREGIGAEKDLKQSIEWLHKAIAAGDATSMGDLAFAYYEGEGGEKDLKQCIEWLHKAISAGHARSMGNLAVAYYEGAGVEKDLKQYIEWLHKAIAAGDTWSMKNLAFAYRHGVGVDIDFQQSMYWFFRAAEGGDEFALDEIRRMYQSREFETDNPDVNITWLIQAVVIEDAHLFTELALKHKARNQTGDAELFQQWLRKAEDLGNIHAFILRSLHRIQQSESINDSLINQLTDEFFKL